MARNERAAAAVNMGILTESAHSDSDHEASFVLALLSITKSVRNLMGRKLAELDLYAGQDELLMALDAKAPTMVSHLSNVLAVRPSTTSKMLDVLESKGLVRRAPHKTDGRMTMVELTQLGVEKQRSVRGVWQAFEEDLSFDPDASPISSHIRQIDQLLINRLRRLR